MSAKPLPLYRQLQIVAFGAGPSEPQLRRADLPELATTKALSFALSMSEDGKDFNYAVETAVHNMLLSPMVKDTLRETGSQSFASPTHTVHAIRSGQRSSTAPSTRATFTVHSLPLCELHRWRSELEALRCHARWLNVLCGEVQIKSEPVASEVAPAVTHVVGDQEAKALCLAAGLSWDGEYDAGKIKNDLLSAAEAQGYNKTSLEALGENLRKKSKLKSASGDYFAAEVAKYIVKKIGLAASVETRLSLVKKKAPK